MDRPDYVENILAESEEFKTLDSLLHGIGMMCSISIISKTQLHIIPISRREDKSFIGYSPRKACERLEG